MSRNINDAALRYLSSRSRTVFEMRKHLAEKGFSEEETECLTEEFREFGYLDDMRYCMEYFRYAFGRGKGKRKVFYELREKGVSQDIMEIAFEDFTAELEADGKTFDERQRGRQEAEKVLRLAGISPGEPVPEKILARIGRKLSSRGYQRDVIYSILGELGK